MGASCANLVVVRTREPAPEDGLCTVPDCYENHYAKGRCKRHYYRNKRGIPDGRGREHGEHKWNIHGERWCNYHQEYHDPSEFGNNSEIVDGLKGDCRKACAAKGRIHRYGLTDEEFESKIEGQQGLCAICRVNPATHVDHDHSCCPTTAGNRKTCGKCMRDILCRQCNAILGKLESEGWLEMALKYLEKYRHGGKAV